MTAYELPAWPEKPSSGQLYRAAYHRKRAEAAIARLKVAVEALKVGHEAIGCGCACFRCKAALAHVNDTLAAIGPLPAGDA